MKIKYALFPYVLFIVIFPGILVHLGAPFGIKTYIWEFVIDGIMAVTAITGLILTIIKRKKQFHGWIPMLVLAVFFLAPQLYLWKSMDRGFNILRQIYRFALLYITLFMIPLNIRFTRKEICILIGCFVLYGLICCVYEIVQHPRVWEAMAYFSGKGSGVQSFFDQKNRFGAYLALWTILCIFAFQLSNNKLWFIPAVIFMAFLVMTESRGGLLLIGLFIVLCIISYRKRMGTANMLFVLVDIAVILILLWIIPATRSFITAIIDTDRGVTGRDRIWEVSWNYFLESNPLFGHGIGVQIERIMIERLGSNVSTHNMYLYILNSGGICLVIFYILTFTIMLRHPCYRHHYLIPLLIAVLGYGFFELASTPFDYWHLSNMFTTCLFFIPAITGIRAHRHRHHHIKRGEIPIHSPGEGMRTEQEQE